MRKCLLHYGFSILLFACFAGNCYGQIFDYSLKNPYRKVFIVTDNFDDSYLAILENGIEKMKADSVRFSMLNDLAYYWHTRNLTVAYNYTRRGLNLTSAKKDTLWIGRFQITMGAILLRMEKLDSAYLMLESARSKVKEEDLPFLNTQLGYVFERRGELDRAADFAFESLRLGEKLNDKKAIALAYSDLSNISWKQSKFEKGLEYGLKSVGIFKERNINDLDYDFTLYVVGNNYLALKKYEQALDFYVRSIAMAEHYGFYNNLSDVYISLVDLYAYLKKFDKAAEAGTQAIRYARFLHNNFMLMRSWLSVGKLQNLQGKYISAIASLKESINIATADFGDKYFLSQAYEALGKAYAGNHNYKDAYQAFAEYDKQKNLIFTIEADERISLLQTEFDVAQKESTIQLQEIELKKQRTWQILISIIAGMLLLFLGMLYKTGKTNRKKNKLLEQQNKEKEFLLKEIHHRVKNNLEIVSGLLALQSAQIKDLNVIEAMQESQHRIQSMSMIHKNLYLGRSLASIEMKDYFLNLGNYITDVFGVGDRVTIVCEMDSLELDVDMAVPIGLIVNELLTNSLKYAFPDDRKGIITISLKEKNSLLQLNIADNGIGIFPQTDIKGTGFGTRLIELLTRQLDGRMTQKINKGTVVSFEFQINKAA